MEDAALVQKQQLSSSMPQQPLTSPPIAPLRSQDLEEGQLDSGKMVSLADLHVNTKLPTIPKGGMPPGIDPLDPLLQMLVQDRLFIAAVQTRQLHAAAASAVKLLKDHFSAMPAPRPADKKHEDGRTANGNNRYYGSGLLGPGMQSVKQQVLQLEDSIPWTMVRRTWRNRRPSWRRQVKNTDAVADLAARLKELRAAMLTEETALVGCGHAWKNQLDACIHGRGSAALLMNVWDEFRTAVRGWLDGKTATSPATSAQLQANAVRAVQAMHAAVKQGGPEHLFQTPVESIVGNDSQGLNAVRQAIELERRIVSARLAGMARQASDTGADATAPWEEDDGFDSAAETEGAQQGSDLTDLNPVYDD